MIVGTCHFVDFDAAVSYYSYGFSRTQVKGKVSRGEIKIGRPKLKKGQTLFLIDGHRRYGIEG